MIVYTMEFVHIFTARNEAEAILLKGFLENKRIKTAIIPDSSGIPLGGMAATLHLLPHGIFVPRGKVSRAKRLLKGLSAKRS